MGATCLMYRGDVTVSQVNRAIEKIKIKEHVEFVDWSPCGFKVGISHTAPSMKPEGDLAQVNRAVCMIANSTSVRNIFERITCKFVCRRRNGRVRNSCNAPRSCKIGGRLCGIT